MHNLFNINLYNPFNLRLHHVFNLNLPNLLNPNLHNPFNLNLGFDPNQTICLIINVNPERFGTCSKPNRSLIRIEIEFRPIQSATRWS